MDGKSHSLLLIVDVQKAFIHEQTIEVLPVIQELMRHYAHIAASRFHNVPHSNYVRLLDWQECFKNDVGYPFAIRLPENILVVEKSTYNGFTPALQDHLSRLHIQEVHLCGVDTDACILATAMAIFDAGLRPVVMARACASSGGRDLHEAALAVLRRNIGEKQVV